MCTNSEIDPEDMDTQCREVVIKLSEHDASRLLGLIKKKVEHDDKAWKPYWHRLATYLEQSIERAGFGLSK